MDVIANFSNIINLEDMSLMSTACLEQSRTNVRLKDATNRLRPTKSCVNTLKCMKVIETSPTQHSLTELPNVGNRYACAHTACGTTIASDTSSPLYFPNWTALQAHIRERHPPTCPHPECKGRTFSSHKGLKGHLKVHEQKEIEDVLEKAMAEGERPKKRRRGGEVGRDWICEVDGCLKTFKSVSGYHRGLAWIRIYQHLQKKALVTHHNITHLGRRDHVCSYPACGETFGYKHLLQRHTSKAHATSNISFKATPVSSGDDGEPSPTIGWITGTNYTSPSAHRNTRRALVSCPWPDGFGPGDLNLDEPARAQADIEHCAFVFSRAYDLRRHLRADHGLEFTKDEMDNWVRNWREEHLNAA